LLIGRGSRTVWLASFVLSVVGRLDERNWFGSFRCFWSLGFLFGLPSGNGFHTTSKKNVIHIFFEIGSFSVGVQSLLLVFDWFIFFDSETSSCKISHELRSIF
jgi:hypothetical protein